MKVRTGFVSNSSSSSFCIMGYYLEGSNKEINKQLSKIFDKEIDLDDFYGGVEDFDTTYDSEGDALYLGVNLNNQDIDQLQKSIDRIKKLETKVGRKAKVHSGEIYN